MKAAKEHAREIVYGLLKPALDRKWIPDDVREAAEREVAARLKAYASDLRHTCADTIYAHMVSSTRNVAPHEAHAVVINTPLPGEGQR